MSHSRSMLLGQQPVSDAANRLGADVSGDSILGRRALALSRKEEVVQRGVGPEGSVAASTQRSFPKIEILHGYLKIAFTLQEEHRNRQALRCRQRIVPLQIQKVSHWQAHQDWGIG